MVLRMQRWRLVFWSSMQPNKWTKHLLFYTEHCIQYCSIMSAQHCLMTIQRLSSTWAHRAPKQYGVWTNNVLLLEWIEWCHGCSKTALRYLHLWDGSQSHYHSSVVWLSPIGIAIQILKLAPFFSQQDIPPSHSECWSPLDVSVISVQVDAARECEYDGYNCSLQWRSIVQACSTQANPAGYDHMT